MWIEARDAANTVLGGILGGYLGFGITQFGVVQDKYSDFAGLLICLIWAIGAVFASGDRFHRGSVKIALIYLVFGIVSGFASISYAVELGIDGRILQIILAVWLTVWAVEALTMVPAMLVKRNEGE
ncbi:hypothetical protein IP81_03470 [Novosphingobium sp. AAP83]|nr:hypothetical protein IP81_03470 [Novosphingobium sp. AAP83]